MRLFFLFLFIFISSTAYSSPTTEAFLNEQKKIYQQFENIEKELKSLPSYLPQEQKHVLFTITHFFQHQVLPHIQQEEKEIFPSIENRVKHITECTAYEGKLLTQWISNIQSIANIESMDIPAFAAQSHDLVGALKLHFETVEKVLLPHDIPK